MEWEAPRLAVFAYRHDGRITLSLRRKLAFALSLIGALIAARLLFPLGLIALIAPAMVYLGGERSLKLGPRYLICGLHLVYFASVVGVRLDEAQGRLTLEMAEGPPFVIERDKFVSASRDAARSAVEKAQRFAEVAAHILSRVRLAPALESGEPA